MGNAPITVGVRTDKAHYTAGDVLTGRIFVSVKRDAPRQTVASSSSSSSLNISLIGQEVAKIHYTTSETYQETVRDGNGHRSVPRTREHHHYDDTKHDFFQLEYPICTFGSNELSPGGQYEYPFSIRLPGHLPSTMDCSKGQSSCHVQYQLTAKLVRPNAGLFDSTPSHTQTVLIAARAPKQTNTSAALPPETTPIYKSCCHCKVRGTMTLSAKVDKTVVAPNQTLQVEFAARNDSTVKVRTVRIQLDEIVDWRVHGRSEHVSRTLTKVELPAEEFPELAKQKRRNREYFGVSQSDELLEQVPPRRTKLTLPSFHILDSYQSGKCIQVRHVLTIRLNTKGCCATTPEGSILLNVVRQTAPSTGIGTTTADHNEASAPQAYYDDTVSSMTSSGHVQPSAPPSFQDDAHHFPYASVVVIDEDEHVYPGGNTNNNSLPKYGHPDLSLPEGQAVLPTDWSAQTADLVEVPMADAVLLDAYANHQHRYH